MTIFINMIRLKTLLTESYESFDSVLSKLGYTDVGTYEYYYQKRLALGILAFDLSEERGPNNERTNIYNYIFYFQPYVRERSRVFGLYKKRYHADGTGLGSDRIDFGKGMFRLDQAEFESKLTKLLMAGEQRIEKIQADDLEYREMPKQQVPDPNIIKKI